MTPPRKRQRGKSSPTKGETGFLSLPREIRDQIYHSALVLDGGIVVFQRRRHDTPEGHLPQYVWKEDTEFPSKHIKQTAFGLLSTNRTVREECRSIFYGENTFFFRGPHDWQREINWSIMIGDARQLVNKLDINCKTPDSAFQMEDGSRRQIEGNEKAHPRIPLLEEPADGFDEGFVDIIDPNWEHLFRRFALGTEDTPTLTLILESGHPGFPGALAYPDSEDNEELYFSMDVPNVLEHWRAKYSAPAAKPARKIDVLWKIITDADEMKLVRDQLGKAGWDIIKEERRWCEDAARTEPADGLEVFMRRRPLGAHVEAARPNPYNGMEPPPTP